MRKAIIQDLLNTIHHGNQNIINLYGEKGVGKSYLVKQLKDQHELTKKYVCGYFDFEQYSGMSASSMVNALYDMCDFLYSKEAVQLLEFDIADRIDSARNNRIPYSDRRFEKGLNTSVELTEFVSEFVELPYIGAGIKAAKVAARIVNKYRPKTTEEKKLFEEFSQMNEERLHAYLPHALANDINHSKGHRGKRILMVVENADAADLLMYSGNWLSDLVDYIENIVWIFVSRQPLKIKNHSITSFELKSMSYNEMENYLIHEKGVVDQLDRYRIFTLSRGVPLYVERILDLMNQQNSVQSLDWEQLNKKGNEFIIDETLRLLNDERKEMLFQLSTARYFDESVFQSLFPGRLYQVHRQWFESSLFERINENQLMVQNTMKEEIQRYMKTLDCELPLSCIYNLYEAELRWFMSHSSSASVEEIGQHMQSLFVYAQRPKNIEQYFDFLMEIRTLLINSGCLSGYYEEVKRLALLKGKVGIRALKEKAMIDLYCANYRSAHQAVQNGIDQCDKENEIQLKLQFLNIRMNLEYISPSLNKNSVEQCIETATEYLNTLQEHILEIPYKTYMTDLCKIKLYLAKQYVIHLDYDQAENYLKEIFEICDDSRKLSALSLYALCAKAQEQMGEIIGLRKRREEAIEMYEKSVESYQVAEVVQMYWDSDFYLNYGLVHKRMTEEYLHLALLNRDDSEEMMKKALSHLNSALDIYKRIKDVIPELIDTYSRMLFACIEVMRQLWCYEKFNDIVEDYMRQANLILDEAFGLITARNLESEDGNRQLCNARTMISRLSAFYYERTGQLKAAEIWFQQTLKDGAAAIKTAPMHPYGYTETAQGYAGYALFLKHRGRNEEAQQMALKGMETLQSANRLISNPNGFKEIQDSLEQLLDREV